MSNISLTKILNSKEPQHCLHHTVLSKMKPELQIAELLTILGKDFSYLISSLITDVIYVFLVSPLQDWKIINSYSNHCVFFTLCE